jgi:hypothetical protein
LSRVYFTDRNLGTRFAEALRAAGLHVERHDDHFEPNTIDEAWLSQVGRWGWVALTHDRNIRYKPNELAAVVKHQVSLLVIVGAAPYPELAQAFLATLPRIESFLARHTPPFIGKVYRPSPAELRRNPSVPGRVDLWYPRP